MSNILFLFGIIFEIVSIKYFSYVSLFLLIHFIASVLFSFSFWKNNKKKFLSYFFVIFFVPLIGAVFLFFLDKVFLEYNLRERLGKKVSRFGLEDLMDKIPSVKIKFSEAVLSDINNVGDYNKLRILSYLTSKTIAKKGAVLKSVLSDKNDEIRLLAFSIYSKEEDKINKEILIRLEKLKTAKEEKKARLYMELGELYWEFIFLQIADSELKNFYMDLAMNYFQKSLEIKEIKEVYFYIGRIYLFKKDLEKAKEYFFKDINSKTIPYVAEIFFNEKKFDDVKDLIESLRLPAVHQNFYFTYKVWE